MWGNKMRVKGRICGKMLGKGLDLDGKYPPAHEDINRGKTTGNIKSSGK